MKNYNEMAQSVLKRSETIMKQRKKRRKSAARIAFGLTSCILVVLLVAGIWQNRLDFTPDNNNETGSQVGVLETDPPTEPMHYASVEYLTKKDYRSQAILGQSFQYVSGTASPVPGESPSPPMFEFDLSGIHAIARAVEEYPGVYETLNEYGSTRISRYRLFRMQVVDPLDCGLNGDFFYILPAHLKGDLTQYDALLISMAQLPRNYVLRCGDSLTAFAYLFTDSGGYPELGNIIAFTDGIFDESLWQDRSWTYGYQFAKYQLDRDNGNLLVYRGSTLEEALQRRQAEIDNRGEGFKSKQVMHYETASEDVVTVLEYIQPFDNGVFVPSKNFYAAFYTYRRYINGCPTNESIWIDYANNTVTTSEYRFEDTDLEGLPNISQYIASLDLSTIVPQHTDEEGKLRIYQSAVGWYEKTEDGIYSIVRIAWRYFDEADYYIEYYDETFILLDKTGDRIVSREELVALIGENRNISQEEYGVGISMPMY